jgi:sugar phosphate isomerase/epimerase
MDHVAIIRALGGPHALAEALRAKGLNVADVTARSWTLTGRSIPAKYWTHVAQIAADKKLAVSFEAMANAVAA